jgi:small subunit ribosomal protein S17
MQNNVELNTRSRRKFSGIVASDKMDKTIIVKVVSFAKHKKYKKILKRYTRYKVHDEKNQAKAGDSVRIIETRPVSRDKRWRLIEILETKS